MHSVEKSISLNSGIFKCFITLEKNEISILAFSSSLVIILSSCTNAIFSEDFALSEKRDFTVFSEPLTVYHIFLIHNSVIIFFKFFQKIYTEISSLAVIDSIYLCSLIS